MTLLRDLERLLLPIRRRLAGVVVRGVVRLIDDSEGLQLLQTSLLAGETRDRLERFQSYGLTSAPLPGAEAIVLRVGASPDHAVVLAVDDRRYRVQGLQGGEVALYDDQGSYVLLRRGGRIEISSSAGVLVLGDLEVQGSISASADVEDSVGPLSSLRTKYNSHTHVETGGTTGPPTPVDP